MLVRASLLLVSACLLLVCCLSLLVSVHGSSFFRGISRRRVVRGHAEHHRIARLLTRSLAAGRSCMSAGVSSTRFAALARLCSAAVSPRARSSDASPSLSCLRHLSEELFELARKREILHIGLDELQPEPCRRRTYLSRSIVRRSSLVPARSWSMVMPDTSRRAASWSSM